MTNSRTRLARIALASLAMLATTFARAPQARADSAYPTSIAVYPYPVVASPAKIPVTVDGCGVFRLGRRLHVGFTFRNLELTPMTAVKISVDLYDPFHSYLTTLDATLDGDYGPGARIEVPELPQPGDRMPAFEAFDVWPSAASAVCYVSSVLYADGNVWHATERPNFEVASHALDDMTRNAQSNANAAVRRDLDGQRTLGYRMAAVAPSPNEPPDGWKTASPGLYVDVRHVGAGLQMLAYVSLTGAGGAGAFKPTDIPTVRTMAAVRVTDRHATTVCGGRPAESLALRGTTTSGPQEVEALKVRTNGVSYVASYTRSFGAAPDAAAEAALTRICY